MSNVIDVLWQVVRLMGAGALILFLGLVIGCIAAGVVRGVRDWRRNRDE